MSSYLKSFVEKIIGYMQKWKKVTVAKEKAILSVLSDKEEKKEEIDIENTKDLIKKLELQRVVLKRMMSADSIGLETQIPISDD